MLFKVCDGLGSSAPINYFLWTALDPEDINDFYLTANELSEMPETLKIKKVKLYVLWSRPKRDGAVHGARALWWSIPVTVKIKQEDVHKFLPEEKNQGRNVASLSWQYPR